MDAPAKDTLVLSKSSLGLGSWRKRVRVQNRMTD